MSAAMSFSLHHRLAEARARRVHPVDMPPAVAALHWFRYMREHIEENADLLPSEHGDIMDYNSGEIEYARKAWLRCWAKARSLRDTIPMGSEREVA